MGLMDKFDDMKKKGKDLAGEHGGGKRGKKSGKGDHGDGDMADKGVEKGKDFINEKTGGKYSEQIDKGADMARDRFRK